MLLISTLVVALLLIVPIAVAASVVWRGTIVISVRITTIAMAFAVRLLLLLLSIVMMPVAVTRGSIAITTTFTINATTVVRIVVVRWLFISPVTRAAAAAVIISTASSIPIIATLYTAASTALSLPTVTVTIKVTSVVSPTVILQTAFTIHDDASPTTPELEQKSRGSERERERCCVHREKLEKGCAWSLIPIFREKRLYLVLPFKEAT